MLTLDGVTGTNPSSYERNPHLGYAQQWNLNIQHEFARNWMLQVGYFAATGTHLFLRKDGNPVVKLAAGNRDLNRRYLSMAVPGTNRIITPLGAVNRHEWSGNSSYHSLQAKVEHRFAQGFTVLSSYIFSRALSNQLGFTTSGDAQGSGYQNLIDFRQERSLGSTHQKHRWVMSGIWEAPFGHGRAIGGVMASGAERSRGWLVVIRHRERVLGPGLHRHHAGRSSQFGADQSPGPGG